MLDPEQPIRDSNSLEETGGLVDPFKASIDGIVASATLRDRAVVTQTPHPISSMADVLDGVRTNSNGQREYPSGINAAGIYVYDSDDQYKNGTHGDLPAPQGWYDGIEFFDK